MFYIARDDSLACAIYGSSRWYAPYGLANATDQGSDVFASIQQYNTRPGAQYLSVNIEPRNSSFGAFVAYESNSSSVALLNGSLHQGISSGTDSPFWTWEDVSSKLQSSVQNLISDHVSPTLQIQNDSTFRNQARNLTYDTPFTIYSDSSEGSQLVSMAKKTNGTQTGLVLFTYLSSLSNSTDPFTPTTCIYGKTIDQG